MIMIDHAKPEKQLFCVWRSALEFVRAPILILKNSRTVCSDCLVDKGTMEEQVERFWPIKEDSDQL